MFEEFVLHTLQRDCLALTNTLYHLDGEGELRHLDRLLSIPALKAVQWVPGAGKPNVIPVYTDDWGARRRHRQLLRAEAFSVLTTARLTARRKIFCALRTDALSRPKKSAIRGRASGSTCVWI